MLESDLGDETRELLDGSARLALKSDPSFDCYVFIEKRPAHVDELKKLEEEFPDKTIKILPGDANEEVDKICRKVDWRKWRAVCFLDPYGMQVEWSTLKAIRETASIDLWSPNEKAQVLALKLANYIKNIVEETPHGQ